MDDGTNRRRAPNVTASRLEGASPRQLCSIPTLRSGQEERQVRRLTSDTNFSLKSTCRSARGQTTRSSQPVGAASRMRPEGSVDGGGLRAPASAMSFFSSMKGSSSSLATSLMLQNAQVCSRSH